MISTAALHPVCIRTLRAASAHDRRLARETRHTSHLTRTRQLPNRAARLSRLAAKAFARAADLAWQARG